MFKGPIYIQISKESDLTIGPLFFGVLGIYKLEVNINYNNEEDRDYSIFIY